MRALVTGGGGFLGRALVERLRSEGHDAVAAGRSRYPELESAGIPTVQLDVADRDAVRRAVSGCDVVFHVAAKAGVWGSRDEYRRINVEGTRSVVEACRAEGVGVLVHTSSPSVVFDATGRPSGDASAHAYPSRYLAAYPETKAEAERLVLAANDSGLATVALRPHLVYGPRDPHLLPRIFERAGRRRLRIVGTGDNRVSVTYVDNAAAAHAQAAAALLGRRPDVAGRAFFVNDPEPVLLWPWLNRLLDAVGLPRVEARIGARAARVAGAIAEAAWTVLPLPGEPPMTRFVAAQLASSHAYDVEPARRAFGYDPPVDAATAFDLTVAWWRGRLA